MGKRGSWFALFGALLVVTLLVYQPAWHGGLLWDDDGHITKAELRSTEGLQRIWLDVRATQQYYPLLHSAFWVMHRLWGDQTTGYHLVNIALHALSALLFALLLRRLSVPGAWFAAFIFAVHPVHAESVAWITELKNTLSLPLYLGAALAYMRFDETRRPRDWIAAAVLFVLALLTKTVTATLPISLLVISWWRRGTVEWRRDVRPILPLIVLAIGAGSLTAWVERTLIGAWGSGFELQPVERVLLAGRAVWFYLAKLVWPSNLAFIYTKWDIDQSVWWQYLPPLALAGLMIVLWRRRRHSRAPLAALLLYGAALAPALGFVDVYPFRYAYVADHFQYHASLAVIALAAAALTRAAQRSVKQPTARAAVALALLMPLAAITWNNSRQYIDIATLYRSTIARNPNAWMAHHNLGVLVLHGPPPNYTGALELVEQSLRLNPENAEALNTRGFIRHRLGDAVAARRDYEASIRLSPGFAAAHNNLGALAHREGRLDEALARYREAMRLNPSDPEAQRNMGLVLLDLDRIDEAAPFVQRAYELNPDSPEIVANMASLMLQQNRLAEAVRLFERAIELKPSFPGARNNLGIALERLGRPEDAEVQYREVLTLDPRSAIAHDNLGYVLIRQRRFGEAVEHLAEAVRLRPDFAASHASLAAALQGTGRLDEAIAAYRRALTVPPNDRSADVHNGLGTALAERGRLAEAAQQFREALRLDPSHADARANLARLGGK